MSRRDERLTRSMTYRLVRALVDNWKAQGGYGKKDEYARFLIESLALMLDRIDRGATPAAVKPMLKALEKSK